jgi:hypothetical protein
MTIKDNIHVKLWDMQESIIRGECGKLIREPIHIQNQYGQLEPVLHARMIADLTGEPLSSVIEAIQALEESGHLLKVDDVNLYDEDGEQIDGRAEANAESHMCYRFHQVKMLVETQQTAVQEIEDLHSMILETQKDFDSYKKMVESRLR